MLGGRVRSIWGGGWVYNAVWCKKKQLLHCFIPRRLSRNGNSCAKEGRKEKAGTSLLSPSHGPSRSVTSHSRFTLTFVCDQSAK